jgi:uncharacterized protein (TIGR02001 family)
VRAVFLGVLLLAAEAQAQVSGSFALTSDYRFRGVSLSDRRPALLAGVAYDHVSGLYAGALAASVHLDAAGAGLGIQLYGGYAGILSERLSFDVGAVRYLYPEPAQGGSYDYTEVFIGAARDRVHARLYHSSNYFGSGSDAAYVEIDGAFDLNERFVLVAHLGYLRRLGSTNGGPGPVARHQWDAKLGVVTLLAGLNVELGAVGTDVPSDQCPGLDRACAFGIVLTVSQEF